MKAKGIAIAAAAGAFFLAGATTGGVALADSHGSHGDKVKCEGVNSCKGHSECATEHSECGGQNQCKGKGWIKMTKADCDMAKEKLKKA